MAALVVPGPWLLRGHLLKDTALSGQPPPDKPRPAGRATASQPLGKAASPTGRGCQSWRKARRGFSMGLWRPEGSPKQRLVPGCRVQQHKMGRENMATAERFLQVSHPDSVSTPFHFLYQHESLVSLRLGYRNLTRAGRVHASMGLGRNTGSSQGSLITRVPPQPTYRGLQWVWGSPGGLRSDCHSLWGSILSSMNIWLWDLCVGSNTALAGTSPSCSH